MVNSHLVKAPAGCSCCCCCCCCCCTGVLTRQAATNHHSSTNGCPCQHNPLLHTETVASHAAAPTLCAGKASGMQPPTFSARVRGLFSLLRTIARRSSIAL
eukprot:GHRQ01018014.1.p2 GENE.GHRQ01018014.1~~GHRQ01018014.1.p2  ORF type:complete len:101 (-),score=15.29 GHRQ01018014.1:595-897(-)